MNTEQDVIVIGAGMAGASVAAHMAEHTKVRLLEMEAQPGYHSTGRSAAAFFAAYGNAHIRALTRASRAFLYAPPATFCEHPLVRARAVLMTAREGQESALRQVLEEALPTDGFVDKTAAEARMLHPLLRAEGLRGAVYTEQSGDLDVNELHQGYLRVFQRRNGILTRNAPVIGLERVSNSWRVLTAQQVYRADIVINAAGAWADQIAMLAGLGTVGLQTLKRTACLIPYSEPTERWPMLLDAEERFYLKPDAGALMLSPADETPTPPGDVQADDLDIAIAVQRVEEVTTLSVKRVTHQWAGLRSFVSDRTPLIGFDPRARGFFWLAALGGFGIQTAPAVSRFAAASALGLRLQDDLNAHGVVPAAFLPDRFVQVTE